MLTSFEEGGPTLYNSDGVFLYECPKDPLILNGWIFSFWELHDKIRKTRRTKGEVRPRAVRGRMRFEKRMAMEALRKLLYAEMSREEYKACLPDIQRSNRQRVTADAGQTFQSYARTLLITAQQAKAALLPARAVSGTLRVALADSVCSTFLPDLLQQFHALCPQVELVLRTATADEMLRLLSANQIDLAYTLDQPLLLPSLTLAVNVPEPVCFVAPAGHPLADKAEVPLDVLAQQEFLLTERGMSYRDALDQRLAARGLSIHPYIELGSASLLCQMVERGMGLSFLPEYIVRPALSAGRIARLNVPDCTVTMHRQLFYHKDKWLTPQ